MTELSEPKSVAIGEILKGGREARGLDIREVSRQLRLPSSIIMTIEQGRLDQLAPIYRRGYVLNYARLLEIEPETLCQYFDQADSQPPELREVLQTNCGAWRFERYLRVATYVFTTAFIAIPLIWIFVKVAADFFESTDATQRVVSADGEFDRERRVTQRLMDSLGVNDDEQPDAPHLSASTMPVLSLLVPSSTQDAPAIEPGVGPLRDPIVSPQPESIIDTVLSPVEGNGNQLVLEVDSDCWVEITDAEGRRIEYDLLRGGRHLYHGTAPFTIMLGKAGGVAVSVDGRPVDFSAYTRADVARFELFADGTASNN